MLQVVVEHLIFAAAGLALLFYLGSGLAIWLPASLAPYRWLVAPWAGFSLLSITTQFLTNAPFLALSGQQSGYVCVALATVANVAALFRVRRSGRFQAGEAATIPYLWLAVMCLGVWLLCVVPVWSYGYHNVIGENWDLEMYLPLGDYLKTYAQAHLASAPANPLLNTLLSPPVSERTQAFSYFQSALGFLPLTSLQTLVPGLALVRALSIPATYVFFRISLRLQPRAALLACGALSLNALLLWITYNTFAMQVPSFGLLALVLTSTLVVVYAASHAATRSSETWLAVGWMGFFLGGLAVSYNPALTAYFAMAGPAVLVALWICLRDAGREAALRSLAAVLAGGLLGFGLSLVSQLMSLNGFLKQYSEKSGGMGLGTFTSPGDAFGTSLSFRDLLPADPGRPLMSILLRLLGIAGWGALLVALALILVYLFRAFRRQHAGRNDESPWQTLAMLAGGIAYMLLFLTVLNYPYGWFKAVSFLAFLLVGLAAAGYYEMLQSGKVRLGIQVAGAGLLGLMLVTTLLTAGLYWGQPVYFDRATIDAARVRGLVGGPRPAVPSVQLAGSPGIQNLGRVSRGLLSYFLIDAVVYGQYTTAYSEQNAQTSNGLYDFTLLRTGDDPAEYGAGNAKPVWHNSLLALYALPATGRPDLFHKNFRDVGRYPEIGPGRAVSLTVGSSDLGIAEGQSQTPPAEGGSPGVLRQVTLGLAAPATSTLVLHLLAPSVSTSRALTVTVPPGYSAYRSPALAAGSVVREETLNSSGSVYVRWMHLDKYESGSSPPDGINSDVQGLLLWLSSSQVADSQPGEGAARLAFDYVDNRPDRGSQALSLDIYGRGTGGAHFGYWNIDVPKSGRLSGVLQLDLLKKTVAVASGEARVDQSFQGKSGDGTFVASLLVYRNGHVYETFNDVFTFTIRGGKLSSFDARKFPPLFR